MTTTETLLEAALLYAGSGWPVLPLHTPVDGVCDCPKRAECRSPGKHPRTLKGVDDASILEAKIRRWWMQWPLANIAIDLAGANLIDIAPDSTVWHAEFIARGLPRTLTFVSGGGDGHQHYLYTRPPFVPTTRLCQEGEYDILSAGYAVMPPSVHVSGNPYRWVDA
jgi:putative DNA primase/helicase